MRNKHKDKNILKAYKSGERAAHLGSERPSIEVLKKHNPCYTQLQQNAYYQGFDNALGTPVQQRIRKIKSAARSRVTRKKQCPSVQRLASKGYSTSEADLYITAYQEAHNKHHTSSKKINEDAALLYFFYLSSNSSNIKDKKPLKKSSRKQKRI